MFKTLLANAGVVVLTTGIACDIALAQCNDVATLAASDGQGNENFGRAVAVSGDVAIIGAKLDGENGTYAGAAYIYRWIGGEWVEEAKLTPSDAEGWDQFGVDVAVSGDVAVVGAHQNDDNGYNSGSAYVYRFNGAGWVEEQILTASDGGPADLFGYAVSVSDDVVVVGAYRDDDIGADAGAAYVFRHDGSVWLEEAKLVPDDAVWFGWSVAVHGQTALIGAPSDDDNGPSSGSAHLFRFDGVNWNLEQQLLASDGATLDQFGGSVSIHGNTAVVGADAEDNDNGVNAGAAYVFGFSGTSWTEQTKLTAAAGGAHDRFAVSVSVYAGFLAIGAGWDDGMANNAGAVYVYAFDGSDWTYEDKLYQPNGAEGDLFGSAVAIGESTVVAGAYLDNDRGSACVFQGMAVGGSGDCNQNGASDFCDIASGESDDVNDNGIPDECEDMPDPDVNGDGSVNVMDLVAMISAWGTCDAACPADLNSDLIVDVGDLVILIGAWN